MLELFYTLVPIPGMYIRPNLQYVACPGGVNDDGDVFVLGLKTLLTF